MIKAIYTILSLMFATSSVEAQINSVGIVGWVNGIPPTVQVEKIEKTSVAFVSDQNSQGPISNTSDNVQHTVVVRIEATVRPLDCNSRFGARPILGTIKKDEIKPGKLKYSIGFVEALQSTDILVDGSTCTKNAPLLINFDIPLTIGGVENGIRYVFDNEVVLDLDLLQEGGHRNYRIEFKAPEQIKVTLGQ